MLRASAEKSIAELGTKYIDLMLLHWCVSDIFGSVLTLLLCFKQLGISFVFPGIVSLCAVSFKCVGLQWSVHLDNYPVPVFAWLACACKLPVMTGCLK